LTDGQIPTLRAKRPSLSDYVKEIKQRFSHWYNKRHGRKGFFWGKRFKSVLVENGDTLINCLAYIDLNPVRAGLVERPEDYRWCSLAYHVQTGNKDDFLSLDFGLATFSNGDTKPSAPITNVRCGSFVPFWSAVPSGLSRLRSRNFRKLVSIRVPRRGQHLLCGLSYGTYSRPVPRRFSSSSRYSNT
jgi:hypothetical protein